MATRTLKVVIAGDASKAEKALGDMDKALRQSQATADSAAKKIADDYAKMEAAAAKAGKGTGASGLFGSAFKDVAGSGVESAIAGHSAVAGNVLGQLGGAGELLGGISAGAAAAVAGVGLAAVAAVKFGRDAVEAFTSATEAVDHFSDVSGATAQQSSVFVGAAQQMGVSSESLSTAMGRMLKTVNTNDGALRSYGVSIIRTADGNVDAVGTFESVARAFSRIQDPAKRAELASLAFGRGWTGIVDVLEKGGPELERFFQSAAQHAPIFSDEDIRRSEDFRQKTVELGQEWQKFEARAGEKLVPVLTEFLTDIEKIGVEVGNVLSKWDEFGSKVTEKKPGDNFITQGLKDTNKLIGEVFGGDGGTLAEGWKKVKEGADADVRAIVRIGGAAVDTGTNVHMMGEAARVGLENAGKQADITAGKLHTVAEGFTAIARAALNQDTATSAIISSTGSWLDALDSADGLMQSTTQNSEKLTQAQVDGSQKIADAQGAVQDAISGVAEAEAEAAKTAEDAARNVAQAQADYQKAVEDAARNVADADEAASKRIVDAQDRVTEARKRAADQAVSTARRVQDAEQAVRDASVAALREKDDYTAIRRRQEAEQALARAKEDAATQAQDSAGNVAKAEGDLAQTEEEAAKSRADARRQAADQIASAEQRVADAQRTASDQVAAAEKRVEDATDRVAKANQQLDRTNGEVARSLDDASRSAGGHSVSLQQAERAAQGVVDSSPGFVLAMMQRGASLEEINTALAGGKEKIQELGVAFGIPQPIIDALIGQLDGLIGRLLTIRGLTPAAYEFAAAMKTAGQAFQDPGTKAMFDAGIIETVGGVQAIPTLNRDSGGVLPPGLSLVNNQTGRDEWVSTPGQLAAMSSPATGGGGVVNINIAGSVLSERDLAAALANLERLGYRTKRAS